MTSNNGWKIKFASLDIIYNFTYVSSTSATISPALEGSTNLSGATYSLFKDEYALPSDFDRFLKNGSIYDYSGGKLRNTIEESPRDKFREMAVYEPSDPVYRAMLTGFDSSGYRRLRLNPPPKTAKVYPYEYIPRISPMKEYTVGTVVATNASATVIGTSTYFTANVSAGMYFRVDGVGQGDSSKWYKISSVDSNTQLTLESVYSDSTESGVEYTVCSAPTSFPPEFHEFILYEAVAVAGATNADVNSQLIIAHRADILKRLNNNYKSRRTNVQIKVEDDGYR
jgi:predicted peroxiredoxin